MNLPVIYKINKGFTLIEVLVVIGLLIILLGAVVLADPSYVTRQVSRSEVATVVSALQKARSQSMNNIGQKPHGVYFDDANDYVIFSGTYDPGNANNIKLEKGTTVTITSAPEKIIFEQISGNTNAETVVFSDGKEIKINQFGLIEW